MSGLTWPVMSSVRCKLQSVTYIDCVKPDLLTSCTVCSGLNIFSMYSQQIIKKLLFLTYVLLCHRGNTVRFWSSRLWHCVWQMCQFSLGYSLVIWSLYYERFLETFIYLLWTFHSLDFFSFFFATVAKCLLFREMLGLCNLITVIKWIHGVGSRPTLRVKLSNFCCVMALKKVDLTWNYCVISSLLNMQTELENHYRQLLLLINWLIAENVMVCLN